MSTWDAEQEMEERFELLDKLDRMWKVRMKTDVGTSLMDVSRNLLDIRRDGEASQVEGNMSMMSFMPPCSLIFSDDKNFKPSFPIYLLKLVPAFYRIRRIDEDLLEPLPEDVNSDGRGMLFI